MRVVGIDRQCVVDRSCKSREEFLKGIAGSGKSTLITKVFKKFYDSEDVRTLSNNIERKFGLSSLYDGFMFIAPEVKGDLCLEQAEFQSLVSGEDVSIAQKYEKAKSVEWKTPGILGGNEVPNWKDNSGSVLRRLLAFNFGKQVKDADPHLDVKLDVVQRNKAAESLGDTTKRQQRGCNQGADAQCCRSTLTSNFPVPCVCDLGALSVDDVPVKEAEICNRTIDSPGEFSGDIV